MQNLKKIRGTYLQGIETWAAQRLTMQEVDGSMVGMDPINQINDPLVRMRGITMAKEVPNRRSLGITLIQVSLISMVGSYHNLINIGDTTSNHSLRTTMHRSLINISGSAQICHSLKCRKVALLQEWMK